MALKNIIGKLHGGDDKNDKRDQVDVEEVLGAAAGDLVVDKESVSSRIIKSVFCLM